MKYRFVSTGKYPLSDHEFTELKEDFDIDVSDAHVLAPLTKEEWVQIRKSRDKQLRIEALSEKELEAVTQVRKERAKTEIKRIKEH